ncbi:conserved domain protein, partial [Parasutterella excrementihominis YIT 11859]
MVRSDYIKFDIKPLLYSSSLELNFNQCCLRVRLIIGLILATLSLSSQADDFGELAKRCAPSVAEDTLRAIVKTESGFNPYAIGVVKGKVKQPKAYHEAMSTIVELELSGADYS